MGAGGGFLTNLSTEWVAGRPLWVVIYIEWLDHAEILDRKLPGGRVLSNVFMAKINHDVCFSIPTDSSKGYDYFFTRRSARMISCPPTAIPMPLPGFNRFNVKVSCSPVAEMYSKLVLPESPASHCLSYSPPGRVEFPSARRV
jgi:hypothetical protein